MITFPDRCVRCSTGLYTPAGNEAECFVSQIRIQPQLEYTHRGTFNVLP